MGLPENEVAADNERRRMDEISKSPVGGKIGNAVLVVRSAVAVGSALVASGTTSATGLAIAGGVVGGLGIVDWFRKLGNSKVNENLESLGQATEEALSRVEYTLREHGTSIDEIKARIESQEFKNGMASASLQALRTTQSDRLKRLALILANSVQENDLEMEGLDDMMRAVVEVKDADVVLLGEICRMQRTFITTKHWEDKPINEKWNILSGYWQKYWDSNLSKYKGYRGTSLIGSFARLESLGMIAPGPNRSSVHSPVATCYLLLPDGKKFYERLQDIAVPG